MQKRESMIEQIHFGNRGLWDGYRISAKAQKDLDTFCKLDADFRKDLTEEQQKTLDKMLDALDGCHNEELVDRYKDGFKIGMRLAFEAFEEPEEAPRPRAEK